MSPRRTTARRASPGLFQGVLIERDCARLLTRPDQSVERRNSGVLSDFADSDFVSDLTGSILALSTRGVSTRADASTDPVR